MEVMCQPWDVYLFYHNEKAKLLNKLYYMRRNSLRCETSGGSLLLREYRRWMSKDEAAKAHSHRGEKKNILHGRTFNIKAPVSASDNSSSRLNDVPLWWW